VPADAIRRFARRVASSAAIVVLIAAAGCAAEEKKVSGAPVSVPRAPKKAPEPEPAPGLSKKEIDETLAEMASAIQHGDHERALALGDRLLLKKPPEEVREQIERLRKVAKQHLLQSFYVDAVVRSAKERITIGDPIVGEIVLINVGTTPVTIEDEAQGAAAGSGSRTMLRVEVQYREFVPDGTIVKDVLTSNVLIGKRITIPVGQRHSIPLKLDTLEQNPGGTMLRHYDIGGSVFLSSLQAGKETIYGQLQIKPRRVQVFPRNWEHLAERPLDRLADAIRRRSPDHVPLAAALVPEDGRRRALETLRAGLKEPVSTPADAATQRACCVALTVITGEDRKPDPEEWLRRLDELLR
jgi:hypothetical protein